MQAMTKTKPSKRQDWGDGSIRERGGRFQIRWREGDERKSMSGFASRFEAAEELERIHARLKLGQPAFEPGPAPAPKPVLTSFASLVDEWTAYRVRHGRRMALEERTRWEKHLAGPLSTQTVQGASPAFVRELAASLVDPPVGSKGPDGEPLEAISGPTAHRVLTLLSSFYSWACDEGHAKDNPARVALRHKDVKALLRPKRDPKDNPNTKPLRSWAEVTMLYKALEQPVAVGYLISARAGLRPGEVIGLRWGDIDLRAKTIRVERQVRSGKEGPTKSGKPRTVPIVPSLARELVKWRKASTSTAPTDLVCPPPSRTKRDGTAGAQWGTYLGPKAIRETLASGCKTAKLRSSTLYAYGRHTFGSLAALGGISAWRLKDIMGHQDIKTTLRYVDLAHMGLTDQELAALGG